MEKWSHCQAGQGMYIDSNSHIFLNNDNGQRLQERLTRKQTDMQMFKLVQ